MNWIEIAGFVLSLAAGWLTTRRLVISCPVGLASVIVYAVIFVDAKLYSDALLQGVFAAFIVYAWVHWRRHLDDGGHVEVVPLSHRHAAAHVLVGALCAIALGAGMHYGTDAALPWLDATLAAFSLVAQFWQARRHAAAWWLWIGVDLAYIGEYIYKDLWLTAVLYAVFVALAVLGLRAWNAAARAETTHATAP